MSYTVTFDNPYYTYSSGASGTSATVSCYSFSKSSDFEAPDTAQLIVRYDVLSKYDLETDSANNPLMIFSRVVVEKDGSRVFEGFVNEKPTHFTAGGVRYIAVTCLDRSGVLLRALCPDTSGNYEWIIESSVYALTNLPMKQSSCWGKSGKIQYYTLWADPSDTTGAKCYVDGASDTLSAGIGTADTTIPLSSTEYKGFQGRGWVKIDSEWIYYDGYSKASDSVYKLRNCVRGDDNGLGTASATHTSGATVTQKIAKQIAPARNIDLNDSSGSIDPATYSADPDEGTFKSAKSFGSAPFTGNYSVYDEDASLDGSSVVKRVSDVWRAFVTAPSDYGGAGFTTADLDVISLRTSRGGTGYLEIPGELPNGLCINRWDYGLDEQPDYAYDAIRKLIEATTLTDDTLGDELVTYYNHTNDKLVLELVSQASTPDLTLSGVSRIEKELTGQDLISGVLVRFTEEVPVNMLSQSNMWHDTAANEGIDSWRYVENSALWDGSGNTSYTGSGNQGMDYIIDGKTTSKFYGYKDGGNATFSLYFWFGDGSETTPPAVLIDRIYAEFGNYFKVDDDPDWHVDIQVCTDFEVDGSNIPVNPASKSWTTIIDVRRTAAHKAGVYVLEKSADELATRTANGVRVRFLDSPCWKDNIYQGALHEFEINAHTTVTRYLLVTTTDVAGDDTGTLDSTDNVVYYYPGNTNTHKKLRGATERKPGRIELFDIGASSQGAALTLGRIELAQRLKWYQQRFYEYHGELSTIPELGMTVKVNDDNYTGVLRGYTMEVEPLGKTKWTFRLLDYDAGVVQ